MEAEQKAVEPTREDFIKNVVASVSQQDKDSSLTKEAEVKTEATETKTEEVKTEATPAKAENPLSNSAAPVTETPDLKKYEDEIQQLKQLLDTKKRTNNPLIDRLLELHEQGIELKNEDELFTLFRPLEKINPQDLTQAHELVIEKKMKEEGYTKEQVEILLESEYPLLFEEGADADSKEYKAQEIKFTREAKGYLDKLVEKQKQVSLPPIEPRKLDDTQVQAQYTKWLQDGYSERVKQREPLAEEVVKGRDKTKIKFGEVEIDYEPSAETIAKVKEDIRYIDNLGAGYVNKDGTVNYDGLFNLLAFRHDAETLFKAYGNKRASEAAKKTIKDEVKNSNFEAKSAPTKTLPVPENHRLAGPLKALLGITD